MILGSRRAASRACAAFFEMYGSSIGSSTECTMPSSSISRTRLGTVCVARMPPRLRLPSVRSRLSALQRLGREVLVLVDLEVDAQQAGR